MDALIGNLDRLREQIQGRLLRSEAQAPTLDDLQATLAELEAAHDELRQQSDSLDMLAQSLEDERRRYQELFEFAPDGYLVTDVDGAIREANQAVAGLLDVDQTALIGKPLVVFVEKSQKNMLRARLARLRTASGDSVRHWDLTLVSRFNKTIPVSITVGTSEPRGGRPRLVRWMIRDMTERYQTQQALSEKTEAFETVFSASPAGLVVLDRLGQVTMSNAAADRMLGWAPWEMLGKPLKLRHHDGAATREANVWYDIVLTRAPVPVLLQICSPHGQRHDVSLTVGTMVDTDSQLRGCVVILTETGEASRQPPAEPLHRHHLIREEERRRLAREIHDEMGQALTGLKFDLARLERDTDLSASARTQLQEIHRKVGELMLVVRRVSSDLRPPILDDLGLPAAIEWQAEQFQSRTGIACEAAVATDLGLSDEIGIALFRIYQEILTNVARHARARRVIARLEVDGQALVLRVSDDGVGFSLARQTEPATLGIRGMQERAALIGAEIRIDSAEGRGTTVSVRLPLQNV